MKVLVLNCGSSSVKFAVDDTTSHERLASGLVENISPDVATLKAKSIKGKEVRDLEQSNHLLAIKAIDRYLEDLGVMDGLDAIGHRVVHGGDRFTGSVLITDEVIREVQAVVPLAPLHNPANLQGILCAKELFPTLPQVGVFDTSFHMSMPPKAYRYAIPKDLYETHRVRRYGFHGTSHRYVVAKAAQMLGKPLEECSFITCHLGNGASCAAIKDGKSVDTSMGLTPLEGLVMGTRSGDLDPGIPMFLHNTFGWDVKDIDRVLNKNSGLKGLSGMTNDCRTLEEAYLAGNPDAILALDVFVYRLAKYVASFTVPLDRLDAVIFTGGIGEKSPLLRANTLNQLKLLGFHVDESRNKAHGEESNGVITTEDSTRAMVVPTNEELLIALDTEKVVKSL